VSSPESESGVLVEWRLYGATRGPRGLFQSLLDSFSGLDSRLGLAFQASLAAIGERYSDDVKRRFNEKHGRTGETADTIHGEFRGITADNAADYAVIVGGHIGAVINPLPAHFIASPVAGLNNDMSGPWNGRNTNFYSPFGPSKVVYWYQGGPESYSPDRSWYEDAQGDLELEGQLALNKLAPVVQQEWDLITSGEREWSYGQALIRQASLRSTL
jgi:hypothetical protein